MIDRARRAYWLGTRHEQLTRASLWVFAGALVFGQVSERPVFEVASVRPSAPVPRSGGVYFGPPRGGPGTPDPEQITWSYATLRSLLMTAYDVKTYQVTGPAWLDTERYDIAVKVPAGATQERVNRMWQNLLADRFGVKLHHEPKEFQVEELVIAKGGPKLKETAEDLTVPWPPGPPKIQNGQLLSPGFVTTISPGPNAARVRAVARAQGLSPLTAMLSNQVRRPVLDKTELIGRYDFNLEFALDLSGVAIPPPPTGQAGDDASEPGPDLAAAVQQQLGLRMMASRATLDVVVIDKAEKVPTEN
jgi:uncharacterized protein (TIGR03435 family)